MAVEGDMSSACVGEETSVGTPMAVEDTCRRLWTCRR